MSEFSVRVAPDRNVGSRAFLAVKMPIGSNVEFELDAVTIDDLIENLSQARAQIVPVICTDPLIVHKGKGIVDPAWAIEVSDVPTYTSIAIRHPGKGWISGLWSKYNLKKLHDAIKLALSESDVGHS